MLKTFKTTIAAPTCFGLHKPPSESYSLYFAKVTTLIVIIYVVTEFSCVMAACADLYAKSDFDHLWVAESYSILKTVFIQ